MKKMFFMQLQSERKCKAYFSSWMMLTLRSFFFQKAVIRSSRSYCDVYGDLGGARFNFNTLGDKERVIKDEKFGSTLRLSLCRPLQGLCEGGKGYRVCLTKDDQEFGIGKPFYLKNTLFHADAVCSGGSTVLQKSIILHYFWLKQTQNSAA